VGNLPFDVQDEAIYTHFARCGKIEFVRIVRDKKTNIGKGFGYVQFKVFCYVCNVNDRIGKRWIRLFC
jgi:RNA recognition motif-containing protein